MKERENIISIRNKDIREADKAFSEFMSITENYMNDLSKQDPTYYRKCTSTDFEKEVEKALKVTCSATPFEKEDIKLISGHKFPDILASKYYGVEVKSTQTRNWTSTGSSIVETTRIDDVDRIYILFGRLGTNPASFKCRPYQECLSEIAVTHSPRYLLDMELKKNEDILSKMGTKYDIFRKLEEEEKIDKVRRYYFEKAKREHKASVPWWMNGSTSVTLSFYAEQSLSIKIDLKCRAFILFPDLFDSARSAFKKVAFWLCNRYSLLNSNIRDMFTAGGQKYINNNNQCVLCPAIVGRLLENQKLIKKMILSPDTELLEDIKEYWDFKYIQNNLMDSWLNEIERRFKLNKELKNIPIKDIFIKYPLTEL